METLVVRLKESLDIENPIFLNEVTFTANNGVYMDIQASTANVVRVVMPKNVTLTASEGSVAYTSKEYTNEYLLTSTSLNRLQFSVTDATLPNWIKLVGVENVTRIGNNNQAGSTVRMKDFANMRYAKQLLFFYGDNICSSTTSGVLSDFCHNTTLSMVFLGNANVKGTVESMVEAFWAEGRRSGDCSISNFSNAGGNVTFHNAAITNHSAWVFKFSASGVTVESPSGTTKGTYDGSTWTYA